MIVTGNGLPKEVIEHWPEVFGEVTLEVLPLSYLHTVFIHFKDGKIWEIQDIAHTKRDGWKSFERSMTELFNTYEDKISRVDFKLDMEQLKKDIEKSTLKFLKKLKL